MIPAAFAERVHFSAGMQQSDRQLKIRVPEEFRCGGMRANNNQLNKDMNNPGVVWLADSQAGFLVSVNGFLSADGGIWGGTLSAPSGRWQVSYPLVAVAKDITGDFKFQFSGSITGLQLNGPLKFFTGGSHTSLFKALPWGCATGEIWTFQPNGAAAHGWSGAAYLSIFTGALTDYSTWRFNLDIKISQ